MRLCARANGSQPSPHQYESRREHPTRPARESNPRYDHPGQPLTHPPDPQRAMPGNRTPVRPTTAPNPHAPHHPNPGPQRAPILLSGSTHPRRLRPAQLGSRCSIVLMRTTLPPPARGVNTTTPTRPIFTHSHVMRPHAHASRPTTHTRLSTAPHLCAHACTCALCVHIGAHCALYTHTCSASQRAICTDGVGGGRGCHPRPAAHPVSPQIRAHTQNRTNHLDLTRGMLNRGCPPTRGTVL